MKKKYSDQELLNILKKKAEQLGRPPRSTEIKSLSRYTSRFGSWKNALKKAGLKHIPKRASEEELLGIIRKAAKEMGRIPSARDVRRVTSIRDRFGSWNKAVKKANLKYPPKRKSDDELLNIIKSKAKELGRVPIKKEVPHDSIITNRFGSWKKAIKKAELESLKEKNRRNVRISIYISKKLKSKLNAVSKKYKTSPGAMAAIIIRDNSILNNKMNVNKMYEEKIKINMQINVRKEDKLKVQKISNKYKMSQSKICEIILSQNIHLYSRRNSKAVVGFK